jgi:hypothetical protein
VRVYIRDTSVPDRYIPDRVTAGALHRQSWTLTVSFLLWFSPFVESFS